MVIASFVMASFEQNFNQQNAKICIINEVVSQLLRCQIRVKKIFFCFKFGVPYRKELHWTQNDYFKKKKRTDQSHLSSKRFQPFLWFNFLAYVTGITGEGKTWETTEGCCRNDGYARREVWRQHGRHYPRGIKRRVRGFGSERKFQNFTFGGYDVGAGNDRRWCYWKLRSKGI